MEYLSSSYLSLPSKSGVYVFLKDKAEVLYVGKAKDLKNRVSSYFTNPALLFGKTKIMVSHIKKIKITIVDSELEALLLEAFFIKKYKPKYNILMKDGKSYLLIRITIKNEFPSILLARKEDDPKSIYFGPFTNSQAVRLVLKTIRRIFPYQSVFNHPKRLCLYHHLGLCPCPPMFQYSQEFKNVYRKNIRGIIRMLEGQSKKIMRELKKERDLASEAENYELALELQRKINALNVVTTPYHKPFEYEVNPNLRVDIRQQELDELMKVLKDKMFIKKLERIECYDISNIQGTHATGSMVVLTNGEIDKSQYRRFRIRKDGKPNDFAMMREVLQRRFTHDEWNTPDLIIIDGGKGQVSAALEILQHMKIKIPLIGLAKREETIVIPKNSKSKYRNTKQIQNANDQNTKRFEHSNFENLKIVSNFGFRASDLLFEEVSLPKSSPALHLIMRIRDEAHRFAITYHKKLRSKEAIL